MAMTEKQIKRRMDEAWEMFYMEYDMEAEWYGTDDSHIWVCDIPSKQITIKMEMNEQQKRIKISEALMEKQSGYDYVRETEWRVIGYFEW